jgi:cytoskeletal protein RodZ
MRLNIGTIISFILLLSALLINIFRYPQVQDMLGQELQKNLIPPVLSYNPDNYHNSTNSDNTTNDESDEPQDNSIFPPEGFNKSELPVIVPQPKIFANPEINSPIPPKPTPEPILTPTSEPKPTQNPEPVQTKELLPEANLGNEISPENLSLQNILPDKNLTSTAQHNTNVHYIIDNHHSITAPVPDTPKPIYANNYQPQKTEPNKIKKQTTQITKPKQRLINTIETAIERKIIYD